MGKRRDFTGWCTLSGKIRHSTSGAARAVVAALGANGTVWQCPACDGWHWGNRGSGGLPKTERNRARTARHKANFDTSNDGTPWPEQARLDVLAGVGSAELARRYKRSLDAGRNFRKKELKKLTKAGGT